MVIIDSKKINRLLANPNHVAVSDMAELQNTIKKHPYFHGPKALELKALKDSGSFIYNQKLKETAAYTTDREVLFQFITNFNSTFDTLDIKDTAEEEVLVSATKETGTTKELVEDTPIESQNSAHINEVKSNELSPEKNINIEPDTPLEFSTDEKHSFSEWLKLTTIKPIIREAEKPTKKKLIESPLIDKFLKNNPKIKPVKKSTPTVNIVTQNTTDSDSLMTETLAKVYIAQKNYKKAIQAYKILSLKNPEKSGLFADQIRAIKKLQDNNQ